MSDISWQSVFNTFSQITQKKSSLQSHPEFKIHEKVFYDLETNMLWIIPFGSISPKLPEEKLSASRIHLVLDQILISIDISSTQSWDTDFAVHCKSIDTIIQDAKRFVRGICKSQEDLFNFSASAAHFWCSNELKEEVTAEQFYQILILYYAPCFRVVWEENQKKRTFMTYPTSLVPIVIKEQINSQHGTVTVASLKHFLATVAASPPPPLLPSSSLFPCSFSFSLSSRSKFYPLDTILRDAFGNRHQQHLITPSQTDPSPSLTNHDLLRPLSDEERPSPPTTDEQAEKDQFFPERVWPKPNQIKGKPCIIGSGSYGQVYRAEYGDRKVAVKIAQLGHEASLEKEYRIMKGLKHENVAEVIGFATVGDYTIMVMELGEGGTLLDLLKNPKIPDKDWITRLEIALSVTKGLRYLHTRTSPIIHRDLNPANLLLRADGSVFLIDFGLAKEKISSSLGSKNIGTARWMAPEMLHHNVKESVAIDTYGLGMVLFGLLTRRRPYEEFPESFAIIFPAIAKGQNPQIPSPESCSSMTGCPDGYIELMKECWKLSPPERPNLSDVFTRLTTMLIELILSPFFPKVPVMDLILKYFSSHQ